MVMVSQHSPVKSLSVLYNTAFLHVIPISKMVANLLAL